MDSKQLTGGILLVVAATLGLAGIFLPWGHSDFFGIDDGYAAPTSCYTELDKCFSTPSNDAAKQTAAIMNGAGSILVAVAVVWLVIAAVLTFIGSNARLLQAFAAEATSFVGVLVLTIGLTLSTDQFPIGAGFWLGAGMAVAAFVAPLLLKRAAATPPRQLSMATSRAEPRAMRATGPPTMGPMAEPAPPPGPPAGPRRVKCPKCANIVTVQPDQRPHCTKCGYGTPPQA